jgi:putative ABC transport system permease protein
MTLLRFVPYVVKTTMRARTRSLLTVLGTALALALFAFVRTLEAGVAELESSAKGPVLVVFQTSRFCPLTSKLPMRYREDIARMDGVEAVVPILLYVNQCQANLDLVTLHGTDPEAIASMQGLVALEGDLESWKSDASGALVGKRLAERRRLAVGDRVRLGEVDVRVGGIVDGTGAGVDNAAYVHLDQLQLARRTQGKVTEFLVRLKPGADPVAVAAEIDRRTATDEAPTDTKSLQAFVQAAVGEISGIVGFARLLGYLAVLVVVLVLGNTVFISAQTRVNELGTLETIGLTKVSTAALLVGEGLLLAGVGGLLGTAAVATWFHFKPTTLGIEGFGIDFVAGAPVLLWGLGASVVVGLLASAGPALEAALRPLSSSVRPT